MRSNECGHLEKKHHARGMCSGCYSVWKYRNNPLSREKTKARNRGRYQRDSEYRERVKSRAYGYHVKYKYGVTEFQIEQILADQGFACALCGAQEVSWCVDHCHDTNVVRGVLCNTCNTGLGKLGDSVEGLERALGYLKGEL